ncbi:hypothetical protein EZJ43_16675 [Pedobacter changchengzhani]|uniref:Uncharacterized protein n=1 Tax=Pedobacter changchengzhani TaxID=2529274 RepID=A0A4R5MH22_9SPHI|nr:hypothetical protein [Pedobacter changchengzhani]TDG34808.1 hypothetical protein EZJ43_16675 [Pedobacter changchengzhani]
MKNLESSSENVTNYMLPAVNFCTMQNAKLEALIDYLGHSEMLTDKCEETSIDGVCVKKKWRSWDELIVTEKEIRFSHSPYPGGVIFTAEQFEKLYRLFNGW